MTIAPIIKVVEVGAPPERAFAFFAENISAWWPGNMAIGAEPWVAIEIEPRPGGRWFERAASGAETQWGRVLDWSPPSRLLLAWQIDATYKYDATFETELEITFEPIGARTRVTLEHRNLERFGDSAQRTAEQLGGGWPRIIEGFARLCAAD